VTSYRQQFSVTPGTTDKQFPFGIVSLADGTSEGHGHNMANFRLAQTASYGILPGPPGSGMERTFIAQAYDAGDPSATGHQQGAEFATTRAGQVDQPYQAYFDSPMPGRQGYSAAGEQYWTQFYMGGIHGCMVYICVCVCVCVWCVCGVSYREADDPCSRGPSRQSGDGSHSQRRPLRTARRTPSTPVP
jgi:hypothetical protein